jgi:hypothetical protein
LNPIERLDVKTRITFPYFPNALRYASPLPLLGGAYLLFTQNYFWGFALVVLSVILFTTRYVTEIDLTAKVYKDYLFFLGFQLNRDIKHFSHVDRIIVTKGNYSQTLNSRIMSRQMDWSDYTGTLIIDNGTLELLTHTNKRSLVLGLAPLAKQLKVGIEDRCTNKFYWIDIDKAARS